VKWRSVTCLFSNTCGSGALLSCLRVFSETPVRVQPGIVAVLASGDRRGDHQPGFSLPVLR
jgi:hypothetical protein